MLLVREAVYFDLLTSSALTFILVEAFGGGIHVVAEGRIGLADELDARAMLEATGEE